MRADVHDGPGHNTLQSEAGYIDARPQSRQIDETSCNARPDHTFGSKCEELKVRKASLQYPNDQTLFCRCEKFRTRASKRHSGLEMSPELIAERPRIDP